MKEICLITSLAGVRNKGLWRVAGRPLVDWVLRTASGHADIVLSTDQGEAGDIGQRYGATFSMVPELLADGNHHVEQALYALKPMGLKVDTIVHLMQPSSPFIRRQDLRLSAKFLETFPGYASVQTMIEVPHNMHEWNQREINEGRLTFAHAWERAVHKTKQTKPARFAFGNLVSVRYGELCEQGTFFAAPSAGRDMDRYYALDVDAPKDLELAEVYLSGGLVSEKEILA